jgi:ribosomal-protein-alanine N-acetyltransferase
VRIPFRRSKEISLELAHGDQARELSDLHTRCFKREWGTAEIANLLEQNNVLCLIAKEVGKPKIPPLAFVMIRMAADEAEILSIGVDPGQRRYGLATKLLDEATRRLHGERTKSLFLEVDQANEPAVNLYKQLRFKSVAERPAYYQNPNGEKSAALVMRLDLV